MRSNGLTGKSSAHHLCGIHCRPRQVRACASLNHHIVQCASQRPDDVWLTTCTFQVLTVVQPEVQIGLLR